MHTRQLETPAAVMMLEQRMMVMPMKMLPLRVMGDRRMLRSTRMRMRGGGGEG